MDNKKAVEMCRALLALLEQGEEVESSEPEADDPMMRMTKPPMRA